MATGTHTVQDLLQISSITADEFGLDEIAQALQADLATYNRIVDEMLMDLAVDTTDRERIYGGSIDGEMLEADEYDRGVAVKAGAGSNVGFPLRKFVKDIGWTADFMLQSTPQAIANAMLGVQQMHTRAVRRDLQRALFGATNFTIRDRYVANQVDLGVKRLVNADSATIPNGPNGETFTASTHTHYDYLDGATPTAAALTALVDDIVEHGHGNDVRININRAAETAVRALSGFVPYYVAGVDPGANAARAAGVLRTDTQTNRAIGNFNGAEVWTKSWVPANYAFAHDAGTELKPLVRRLHPASSVRGLRIVAQIPDYPLIAQVMDSYFGFGVWNRTNGAVLYYAASASAYVEPSFT